MVWTDEDEITVTAPPEHVGQTVSVIEGERTLATETLTTDQDTGYATASIPLPLPPLSHPLAQPVVMLDDQSIGSLNAIVLWGNGQQSFSVALHAAARALGRDPDLERILCLSSNAALRSSLVLLFCFALTSPTTSDSFSLAYLPSAVSDFSSSALEDFFSGETSATSSSSSLPKR